MIVTLSDEFRVNISTWDHKVEVYEEIRDNKTLEGTGKFTWKIIGYFPNMIQAVSASARYKVMSNNETVKFNEYVDILNKVLDEFMTNAKEVFK